VTTIRTGLAFIPKKLNFVLLFVAFFKKQKSFFITSL